MRSLRIEVELFMTVEIELGSSGMVALVDDAFDWLQMIPWKPTSGHQRGVYAITSNCYINGLNTGVAYMHRVVFGALPGQILDHINGNSLDNRLINLRQCSALQNAYNRKRHFNSSSGMKGVMLESCGYGPKRWRHLQCFRL